MAIVPKESCDAAKLLSWKVKEMRKEIETDSFQEQFQSNLVMLI